MSYDPVQEDVPPFVKRLGDQVTQGSNNTIVILGTDRAKNGPATIGDGLGHIKSPNGGKGAGAIHIIAGRRDPKGNPDLSKDDSYIYLSMKSDPDKNLGLTGVETDKKNKPVAVVKSDLVRIVYREDLKICISDGKNYIHMDDKTVTIKVGKSFIKMKDDKIVVDSGQIELGDGASERLILGDSFKQFFESHIHPSAVGPTGPPSVPMSPTLLSQRKVTVK